MGTLATILMVALLAGLGLLGARDGTRRALLALAGTLIAVALVGQWGDAWAEWVRLSLRPDQPERAIWLLESLIFLAVAGGLGYGAALVIPAPSPADAGRDRLLGGLLGLLNAALIASALLRFARAGLSEAAFADLMAGPLAGLLYRFMPWFLLGSVVLALAFIAWRGLERLAAAIDGRAGGQAGNPYDRLNEKINMALGQEPGRRRSGD